MPSIAASAVMPPPTMAYLYRMFTASALAQQPRAPPVRVYLALGLADGTVIRFPVLVVDHRDAGPAPRTGLAALAVHRETLERLFHRQSAGGASLARAAGPAPVDVDAALEGRGDRVVQPAHLVLVEGGRHRLRRETRRPQDLVRIRVADSHDVPPGHEKGFETHPRAPQRLRERLPGEFGRERLDAEPGKGLGGIQ